MKAGFILLAVIVGVFAEDSVLPPVALECANETADLFVRWQAAHNKCVEEKENTSTVQNNLLAECDEALEDQFAESKDVNAKCGNIQETLNEEQTVEYGKLFFAKLKAGGVEF